MRRLLRVKSEYTIMYRKKAGVKKEKIKKPKPKAFINEEDCSGCEVCMSVCPVDCIIIIEGPEFSEISAVCRIIEGQCTGCTICARDCPWEAITMVMPKEQHLLVGEEK